MAARPRVSEARAHRKTRTRRRNQRAATKPIVRRGPVQVRSREPPVASPRVPRRQTIDQAPPAEDTLTRRPREHTATHRITVTVVRRSRALTVRHLHARTLRRGRTRRRAVAILRRRAPIPRQAIAAAVAEARTAEEAVAVAAAVAAVPMVEVEAPTVEALLLTVTDNLIVNEMARPDIRGGPFSFSQSTAHVNSS